MTDAMTETIQLLLQRAMYVETRAAMEEHAEMVELPEPQECDLCERVTTTFVQRDKHAEDRRLVCVFCSVALAFAAGFTRGMDDSRQVLEQMQESGVLSGQAGGALAGLLVMLGDDHDEKPNSDDKPEPPTGMYI